MGFHPGSLFRTILLASTWPLSVIALVFGAIVAANGHWKPRAASIFTAIIAAITIVSVPFLILSNKLGLGKYSSTRCQRMWSLFLTGMWLTCLVWIANQLNKFHCVNPTVSTTVTRKLGLSFYGHGLTPSGAPQDAIQAAAAMHAGAVGGDRSLDGRALTSKGNRLYARRCRLFKGLLGMAVPIFVLFAIDLITFLWRNAKEERHVLPRSHSTSPSVSSVGSPRLASNAHPGHAAGEAENVAATEAKP
ncbi:hypothetical protein GGI12_000749 [Dipsacomyces acuminosporus]|nr:hypothetical protein GGI12_000749 [Dipsacomyces acuminosporus]